MKTSSYIFPVILIVFGGVLLVLGAMQGQNIWVMIGAGLALVAGLISLLLVMGIISRQVGVIIGMVFLLFSGFLVYRNYRSIAEVIEFTQYKRENDRMVIQGLKDIRTAQVGFRQAHGAFTNDLGSLQQFVRSGTIPMVRAIGQVPDTLSEAEALELGIIVRDTIPAPALDSLFMNPRAQAHRAYEFDPQRFGLQPMANVPYILRAGMIQSSGRNVPVFLAKDPRPVVAGDTLMVGSLEKATTAGNWTGE
jgi:hypothetical protein